jgi:hypothetical protein
MQPFDVSIRLDPLDLLRRFIPTPLKATYRVGTVRVTVQTNDFSLLPTLPSQPDPGISDDCNLEWKLVRDTGSSGLLETPTFLTAGALTVVEMGPACLLGLDHERRELLGFIGADIDARTHQDFLVPFLCRMTNEVFAAKAVASGVKEEFAND